jgi:NADH:ubiquinone oxidoreductase subunit F (NADH-binding)
LSRSTAITTRTKRTRPYRKDIVFFSQQVKIALRNCGKIDFASVEDYIAMTGNFALARSSRRWAVKKRCRSSTIPAQGRGGAGFPTG